MNMDEMKRYFEKAYEAAIDGGDERRGHEIIGEGLNDYGGRFAQLLNGTSPSDGPMVYVAMECYLNALERLMGEEGMKIALEIKKRTAMIDMSRIEESRRD